MLLPGGTADTAYTGTVSCSPLLPGAVAVRDIAFGSVRVAEPRRRRRWTEMAVHRSYHHVIGLLIVSVQREIQISRYALLASAR